MANIAAEHPELPGSAVIVMVDCFVEQFTRRLAAEGGAEPLGLGTASMRHRQDGIELHQRGQGSVAVRAEVKVSLTAPPKRRDHVERDR